MEENDEAIASHFVEGDAFISLVINESSVGFALL